jgi:hypothetical protein
LPEILRKDGYVVSIYCERGGRHHLPHCHLRWGDQEAVVSLATMRRLVGDEVPASGIQFLVENLNLLVKKWDELNSRTEEIPKGALSGRKRARK